MAFFFYSAGKGAIGVQALLNMRCPQVVNVREPMLEMPVWSSEEKSGWWLAIAVHQHHNINWSHGKVHTTEGISFGLSGKPKENPPKCSDIKKKKFHAEQEESVKPSRLSQKPKEMSVYSTWMRRAAPATVKCYRKVMDDTSWKAPIWFSS